jgi:hypothetical protein
MSREAKVGIASILLVLGLIVVSGITGPGDQGTVAVLLTLGIAVIAGAIVFGLVVPWAKNGTSKRAEGRPSRAGLTMSILGFLSIVAFWSGLPIILGAGGAALGQVGRERSVTAGSGGVAMAALIVGIIAAVVGMIIVPLEIIGI